MNHLLDILAEFGGGRGAAGNNAVRFLLAAFFWLVLFYIAFRQWRRQDEKRDLYVGIAALIGLSRELIMFVVQVLGGELQILPHDFVHNFYPPIEHAFSLLSILIVGYAVLEYYFKRTEFSQLFLVIGLGADVLLYAVITPNWAAYLVAHPDALFGQHWGDMLFRITGAVLMAVVLAALANSARKGRRVPIGLIVAFLFFLLDELLMIVNLANGDTLKETLGPIRHNLHIWAIPMIVAAYWSEMYSRVHDAEREKNSIFDLSPSMLFVTDYAGKIRLASPATLHVLGRQPTDLIGHRLEELGCEFGRSGFQTSDTDAILERLHYEGKYLGTGGQEKWLQWRIQPRAEDRSLYVAASDITERKQAEQNLRHSLETMQENLEQTIQAMAMTVEIRDAYTAGHQKRVAALAFAIAQEMGLPVDQTACIRLAGLIHDVGKIGIPAEIIGRPGKLSEVEFSLVKSHSQVGFEILRTIRFPWPIARMVQQHHERMNGTGYPLGLRGDGILLESRVLGVADVVEAMASHRPYRPALGINKAMEEITQLSGILYDPQVVNACLRLFIEKRFSFQPEAASHILGEQAIASTRGTSDRSTG